MTSDPSNAPKGGVTCYAAGEGGFMAASQAWRGRWLRPLLVGMGALGLKPNHLTFLSLLTGLGFGPALWWGHPVTALVLLLLHVLLDGLDGPLARQLGVASNRGSFTDTMADQVVVTVSTIALMQAGHAGIWPGALYLFCYGMVVGFAMVRNALAIPYSWLVRPRFFVYAWLPAELFLWPGTLDLLLWVLTLLLAVKMLTGFLRIRRAL